MKLSLMHKMVATIDKDYRSPILSAVGAPWGCAPDKVYFWRASANFACVTAVGDQRVFLRFNGITARAPQLVEAEVEVLNALAKLGLSVNAPVKSLSGRYVEVVATEWGVYVAVASTACSSSPD
ncbi:MAG: hypothetical protein DDT20_00064 [Firmicutes bacterium]|nr:hypothetical protein [Bacillota bacterium]